MKSKPPAQQGITKQSEIWSAWEIQAQATLLEAMKRREVGYKELSALLEQMGIHETPDRLNRKVNRRKFSAAFHMACLKALEK